MTDNVVLFPKGKRGAPPQTMEELLETVEEARKEHIEFIIDEVLSYAFSRCYEEGFDLNQEQCFKTTAMIIEAFRSGLYKAVGIEHPLHHAAEGMFVVEESLPISQNESMIEE